MSLRPPLFLGAYAASPNTDLKNWEPRPEEEFFRGLSAISTIQGLELPFYGTLHPRDPAWLIRNFDPRWQAVLTCLPGTMNALQGNPGFGLASPDEEGRRTAIAFLQSARHAAEEFNQAQGRQVVRAIQLHSAPTARASAAAFLRSLREVLSWDWNGVELWVEHCDAHTPGKPFVKGFLSLKEELEVIREAPAAGICINWGRSVIEARDPAAAREHLEMSAAAGGLRALFFSGASRSHPRYGDWSDSHAPFASPGLRQRDPEHFEEFLLTEARTVECLKAADFTKLSALGIKVQTLPKSLSVFERLQWLEESVEFLDLCCSKASTPGMKKA